MHHHHKNKNIYSPVSLYVSPPPSPPQQQDYPVCINTTTTTTTTTRFLTVSAEDHPSKLKSLVIGGMMAWVQEIVLLYNKTIFGVQQTQIMGHFFLETFLKIGVLSHRKEISLHLVILPLCIFLVVTVGRVVLGLAGLAHLFVAVAR